MGEMIKPKMLQKPEGSLQRLPKVNVKEHKNNPHLLLHPSGTIEGLVVLKRPGLHRQLKTPVVVSAAALTSVCNVAPESLWCFSQGDGVLSQH